MQIRPGLPAEAPDLDSLEDPAAYAKHDLHPVWRARRTVDPVTLEVRADGTRVWHVYSHAGCTQVLKRTEFSVEHGTILASIPSGDPAGGRTITMTDPPRHRQFRHPAMSRLGLSAVNGAQAAIEAEVDALVEGLVGEVEVVAALRSLPMIAVGGLLGFPREHWDDITWLTTASVAADDPCFALGRNPGDTLRRAHLRLLTIFSDILAGANDSATVTHTLKTISVDGSPLSLNDQLMNCYNFALGAGSTTPHVAAHLLTVLAAEPVIWARLRAEPETVAGPLVDEAARWASPTNHLVRRARAATTIEEHEVQAGDWACAWVASANRDESVFADPYRFDLDRDTNASLGFGAGPHYCIGAPAARFTLSRLFAGLARRASQLRVVGEPRHLRSNWINGFTELRMSIDR